MSKRCYKNVCYLICDAGTDLPVACVDTYKELVDWFGCCVTTVWRMVYKGLIFQGFYIEVVRL